MKKPKLNLGKDGIKGLFRQHIEKMVFGVAILLVILFAYWGYSLQSYPPSKTPEDLKQLAARAVTHVKQPTAEALREKRIPREGEGGNYQVRVQEARTPADADVYAISVPWDPPAGAPGNKREDPTYLPPLQLETEALTGALCINAPDDLTNPLADLDNAPLPDDGSRRRSSSNRRSRRNRGGGGSSAMGGSSMMGMEGGSPMMGMEEGGSMGMGGMYGPGAADDDDRSGRGGTRSSAARRYPADKVCGYRPSGTGTMGGGGMMGSGDMMGSGGSPMDMMGGGSSPAMGSSGPTMGMGSGGDMYGAGSGGPGGARGRRGRGMPFAVSRSAIVVKAVVPYRKQADEFERVLGNAIGYDPMRDQPRLVFFEAQRVDVTDDPDKAVREADWKPIMNPKQSTRQSQNWHGFPQEVADMAYVDPKTTMPIPPFMLRCLEDAMLHSEVPRQTPRMMSMMRQAEQEDAELQEEESEESQPDENLDLPGADLPGGMTGMGQPGRGRPGSMGMGGSPMGYGGMSGSPDGYGSMGMGSTGMGSMGMGSMGSMGMGGSPTGYPGMGGRGAMTSVPVQYKLVRFSDMNAELGRVYRYRVRVFFEDPNNPNTDPMNGVVHMPPQRRTLAPEVLERLNRQEQDESTRNVYYVKTNWSEASEPVSLPSPSRMYVGKVSPARMSNGIGGTLIQRSETQAEVAPVVWHDELAVDVATKYEASRGTVLALEKEYEVLDPITLVIKLLKDFQLNNELLVVDLRGGEDLPGDRQKKLESAGECILMDESGSLHVRSELDDYLKFDRYTLADEQQRLGTGMPGMDGGYGPGGMSGPGGSGGSMMGSGTSGAGGAGGRNSNRRGR